MLKLLFALRLPSVAVTLAEPISSAPGVKLHEKVPAHETVPVHDLFRVEPR